MGINYNVQNIIIDNLKEFENRLIIGYDKTVSYLHYIESEKKGWFNLIEKTSKELFPLIENSIQINYKDVKLPFFINKNTDIPNFMDNSELHRTMLFDIKLDLDYRIDQLIKFSNGHEQLTELLNVYIDLLENISTYYDKLHLYQCNYNYCKIILDKEIEKKKTDITTIPKATNKNINLKSDIDENYLSLREICKNEESYNKILQFLKKEMVINTETNVFESEKITNKNFIGFLKNLHSKGYLDRKITNNEVAPICKNTFNLSTTYNTAIQCKKTDTNLDIEQNK